MTDTAPNPATHPEQRAGQDPDIAARLAADPTDVDAKLDAGLDESMDASDPPSMTAPHRREKPILSSGDEESTATRAR